MAQEAFEAVRGDFDKDTTLEHIRQRAELFAIERKWIKYHTPRNLALAMVGEVSGTCSILRLVLRKIFQIVQVGELAELFQWRSDEECPVGLSNWSPKHFVKLSEEISDVILYLVRLSNQCGVNLPAALDRKIRLNNLKYPMEKAMGNAAKYTEYDTSAGNTDKAGGVVDVAKLEARAQLPSSASAAEAAHTNAQATQQSTWVHLERIGFFLAGVAVTCAATALVIRQPKSSST